MRPESSSSRDTKMTPGSSTNSSSAHLPRSNAGARATSGATLLQERLRERKVESARQGRRRSVDLDAGQRDVQSSPVKAAMAREERRPSSSGVTASKGMGVKQIEEVSMSVGGLRVVADNFIASFYAAQAKFRPQTRALPSSTTTGCPRSEIGGCGEGDC